MAADDTTSTLALEFAHVLFMDLVGYSQLSLEQQPVQLRELQSVVQATAEFRRSEASGDLLSLPSGDGMALVFFRDPVAPVRCALQVSRGLREGSGLPLRMGLHSGPVYRVKDINANANVSGGGINVAQRVMDCGDAGHVLLSSAIANLVEQVGAWPLVDLGECEVKHGQKLHLFNLTGDGFGNPERPSRLDGGAGVAEPAVAVLDEQRPSAGTAVPTDPALGQIALLYKRGAEPDEQLLKYLESRFREAGHAIFIDRHLEVGMEWATEISRQIAASRAVVPLLSEASMYSDMLAWEIDHAHQCGQEQGGSPRLLPVRVNFTGPLPGSLASILDRLEYAQWSGPADNERLFEDLVRALNAPRARRPTKGAALEPVGGAVPLDSKYYVVRPADEQFQDAVDRLDSIVLVKGARQMGKTSLLARALQRARQDGVRVVLTDFQKLDADQLASPQHLFIALGEWMADQLDLDTYPDEMWNERRGATINFERYLRRHVLKAEERPLIWALDEVDRLFTCDFGSEVFGLFRSWHNERALDPSGPWSRLTLVIAYATEAHLFITDVNQSPFNVGTRLTLQDFTIEQVADLNVRHGSPLGSDSEIERFYRLFAGQPYLIRRALHEMVSQGATLAVLEQEGDREEGPFGDHLRRILVLLARDPELCNVVRTILRGQPCPDAESFYRLRSAGVMAGDSSRDVRPRCELYASFLKRYLL